MKQSATVQITRGQYFSHALLTYNSFKSTNRKNKTNPNPNWYRRPVLTLMLVYRSEEVKWTETPQIDLRRIAYVF